MSAVPPSSLREAQKAAVRTASAATAVAAAMAAQELQAAEKRRDAAAQSDEEKSDSSASPLQGQEEGREGEREFKEDETEEGDVFTQNTKKGKATFFRLGIDIELQENATEFDCQASRIKCLENLDQCPHLKRLALNANEIAKLENLEAVPELEELELYQNRIRKMENLSCLSHLRVLDLSFNRIKKIEELENLRELSKLYLSSNRIEVVEGLDNNKKLTVLELGGNRLREVKGISQLQLLQDLWLGKNKLTSMELPLLPALQKLSMQSNRLTQWDEALFTNCPSLQELYLSNNRLPDKIPSSIKLLKHLRVLDVGANAISDVEAVAQLPELQELWANDNQIEDLSCLEHFSHMKKLEVLYLEGNPLHFNLGPSYRQNVTNVLPQLKQLDALLLNETINIVESRRSTAASYATTWYQWNNVLTRPPAAAASTAAG